MAYGTKTGGRKAGTPNKVTSDLRGRIEQLVNDQFDVIKADLETLDPKDRIAAYQRFIEYVLPKQREQKIDLSSLSDEQIDDLLDRVLDKMDYV